MKLIDFLENQIANEESYFRQYLAKEDLSRVKKLIALAQSESNEEYHKQGLFIGWSKDDMRTHELKDTLIPLMDAIYEFAKIQNDENDTMTLEKWHSFHEMRLKVLIHCL